MNLYEYRKQINKFMKLNPQAAGMEVWYASDDEGNDFHPVIYAPSIFREKNGHDSEKPVVLIN